MKRKRTCSLAALVLAGIATALAGCGGTNPNLAKLPERLMDPSFFGGFNVSAQTTLDNRTQEFNYLGSADGAPQWRLSQWGVLNDARAGYDKTLHDLWLGTEREEAGTYELATQSGSKRVKVAPGAGSIELLVDSTKEYGEIPRMPNEDWPHLLIEQPIGDLLFLSEMKSCWVDIEFELTKSTAAPHNDSTAQFQWIFTVQNLNSAAPAGVYRDYMWFNITLLDERYDYAPGAGLVDGGKADATSKFIYGPAGKDFMPGKVEVGKKLRVTKDFLPEMKRGFEQAQKAGLLVGSALADMGLGSINIGWEVPGLYDVGVRITALSLKVEV